MKEKFPFTYYLLRYMLAFLAVILGLTILLMLLVL